MLSAQTIRDMQDYAAYMASEEGSVPLAVWHDDDLPHLPFLGGYVPRGYRVATWADMTDRPRNAGHYMTPDAIAGLIAHTLTDGGGTFAPRTLRPVVSGGYAVGCHRGTYRTVPLDAPIGALVAAVVECTRDYPSAYIGTWTEDGIVHVDPVRLWESRSAALGYAWGAYQVAIYHLDTGVTLYLTDTLGEYTTDAPDTTDGASLTTCDVCGQTAPDDSHPCAFERACSCWYGTSC